MIITKIKPKLTEYASKLNWIFFHVDIERADISELSELNDFITARCMDVKNVTIVNKNIGFTHWSIITEDISFFSITEYKPGISLILMLNIDRHNRQLGSLSKYVNVSKKELSKNWIFGQEIFRSF